MYFTKYIKLHTSYIKKHFKYLYKLLYFAYRIKQQLRVSKMRFKLQIF